MCACVHVCHYCPECFYYSIVHYTDRESHVIFVILVKVLHNSVEIRKLLYFKLKEKLIFPTIAHQQAVTEAHRTCNRVNETVSLRMEKV